MHINQTFVVKNKVELIESLISNQDVVLDVGFWGQGKTLDDPTWPHALLTKKAKEVIAIDIIFDEKIFSNTQKYINANAENFDLNMKFDVIFAGDLIEHLPNPGLFLVSAKKHLKEGGRLIMTTPNAFNLFVMAGKLSRNEPPINHDHTCYFNRPTIETLLGKTGWGVNQFGFMYTLDYKHKESYKKKILNILYRILSYFTPKFYETLVVITSPK
jgi:2-polyprenyl-3-methyl-5-hydroxy-6-metoxy-1,4-benzoquinol methylase